MKIFKRGVSALLASVMCIPSGLISLSYATETSSDGNFTVTLIEGDGNGTMQFSEECMEASTATHDSYHMMTVNENGELEEVDSSMETWAYAGSTGRKRGERELIISFLPQISIPVLFIQEWDAERRVKVLYDCDHIPCCKAEADDKDDKAAYRFPNAAGQYAVEQ